MANKICGIYKISSKCKPDRFYIGSSVNIEHRWKEHRSDLLNNKHHSPKLQRHYNKYGIDDMAFEIVEHCTRDNLLEREQRYLDTLNPWFNTYPIAGSPLGYKPTKEQIEKVRKHLIGRPCSPETRRKISESNKGKKTSDATKAKQRAAKLGRKLSEEHKRKIGKAGRGRKLSPEARNKIRETLMGHSVSDETKRKISENNGVVVMVINIETGICFNSIMEAALAHNLTHNQLSHKLRVKGRHPFRRVSDYE